jgi:cyclic pyranopterin monophosphate synthase
MRRPELPSARRRGETLRKPQGHSLGSKLIDETAFQRKAFQVAGKKLTHLDDKGAARMVDVSEKAVTSRSATAEGRITMKAATLKLILDDGLKKGNALEVARLAGIMAAKKTSDLIPLCHPLAISKVELELRPDRKANAVDVEATVKVSGQTGVEMEALTAVSVACLTLYDMAKAVDRGMTIGDIRLTRKSGGKSGDYEAN